jgi:hypothetical protein
MKIYDLDSTGVSKVISDLNTPNPTLSVTNTGTGYGLKVDGLLVSSGASINNSVSIRSVVTETIALDVGFGVMGSATVAPIRITASTASQPAFAFKGGCYAAVVTGNATPSYGVRLKFGDTYAWMLAYPAVA